MLDGTTELSRSNIALDKLYLIYLPQFIGQDSLNMCWATAYISNLVSQGLQKVDRLANASEYLYVHGRLCYPKWQRH